MNHSPFLVGIVCDDIRREEGGKLSYMGVYNAYILVPEIPLVLPRIFFAMTAYFPGGLGLPKDLVFRVFKNDELIGETQVAKGQLAAMRESAERQPDREIRRYQVAGIIQFVPLEVSTQCELKARAYCDGEELRGGRWQIKRQDDPDIWKEPTKEEKKKKRIARQGADI